METYSNKTVIRNWAEEDRPREKLLLKGRHNLSDAELLAILIGSGTKNESALDVAKSILHKANDNLAELARMGFNELIQVKGIGKARAVTISAALELGRRKDESIVMEKEKIFKSLDAYTIFRSTMSDHPYEEFWIILLNKGNKVIRKCCISEGGISGTVVDPKKVFKIALDHHASSIILGHNHPSGTTKPSEADNNITKKLYAAGKMLDVDVLDHLIIGDNGFYSYADEGALTG
ncbi:MAG: DNA repair protein RadC [Bacteroidales bacterium]|jgi:DNA repair protein RadC|nr:DNA repair protein RadC [Bacteroidales bacterium]